MGGISIDALLDRPGYVRLTIRDEEGDSLNRDLSSDDADDVARQLKLMAAQARRLLRDTSRLTNIPTRP